MTTDGLPTDLYPFPVKKTIYYYSNLLRLLQATFRHGFALGAVLSACLERYQAPGFEAPEITRILEDTKGYADQKSRPEKQKKGSKKGPGSYRPHFQDEEDPQEQIQQDEELRRQAPLHQHIYLIICRI
ncbi:MAG: hypothetical protein LUD15_05140 [Bacteroides sp.]|nr:hypothetical protein [Bacteroides sp.]